MVTRPARSIPMRPRCVPHSPSVARKVELTSLAAPQARDQSRLTRFDLFSGEIGVKLALPVGSWRRYCEVPTPVHQGFVMVVSPLHDE